MKVALHPADLGGCGYYRLIWPGDALAEQGYAVSVEYDQTYNVMCRDTFQGQRVVGMFNRPDADVIVLQRPLTRNRVEMIQALQAEGIAVVVEVDDDFHAIHPKNPAWSGTNPLRDSDRNRDWLKKACKLADLVTVSTPALAERYGAHGRVAILPNYVPRRYTELDHAVEYPLGWSGSTITHPVDLQVMGDAVDRLGLGFHVIGTGWGGFDVVAAAAFMRSMGMDAGTADAICVAMTFKIPSPAEALGIATTTSTGWVTIDDYPAAVQSLGVGVVPLAMTNFNEAKSWLKGLEYASLGVPFVASPTGPYLELAEAGIGWLASTPDEWVSLVGEMVNDDEHRAALSKAWREEIAARYTIEAHAPRWWDAWALALDNASRREAAA